MKEKKLINKKTLIVGIATVVILSGYLWYRSYNKNKTGSIAENDITTEKAVSGNIVSGISASGTIQTANYLAVTTSVNGIVSKVYVKEGDQVIKGQNIMEITLDSEGEKSKISSYTAYLKAKNALENAKNSLYSLENSLIKSEENFKDVKENNSYSSHDERIEYKIAENDYLQAKASYESKKADISQLEMTLTNAWLDYEAQSPTITAPSDGFIANIVAVEGTSIQNSVSERSVVTVASIKKEGTPIANLNVTEMDIANVKVGQKVILNLNSIPNKIFTGTVAGIDKIGTTASGVANYPVIVKFDETSEFVFPNMSVEGQIVLEEKVGVLIIPSAAITSKGAKNMVSLETKDGVKQVEVTTGISDGSYTEIIKGLAEGDTVQVKSFSKTGFSSSDTRNIGPGIGMMGGPGMR